MAIAFKRKCCATCTFWGGPREQNSFQNGVTCAKSNVEGVCSNPRAQQKNKPMQADYGSCTKYDKWSVLTKL